jgi:hypothetical protein
MVGSCLPTSRRAEFTAIHAKLLIAEIAGDGEHGPASDTHVLRAIVLKQTFPWVHDADGYGLIELMHLHPVPSMQYFR